VSPFAPGRPQPRDRTLPISVHLALDLPSRKACRPGVQGRTTWNFTLEEPAFDDQDRIHAAHPRAVVWAPAAAAGGARALLLRRMPCGLLAYGAREGQQRSVRGAPSTMPAPSALGEVGQVLWPALLPDSRSGTTRIWASPRDLPILSP